jgi:Protein of unknown function (DUF3572)
MLNASLCGSLSQPGGRECANVKYSGEHAEEIALKALTFVASDDGLLEGFLASSGLTIGELRNRAADPVVLAGVLDFLMQADSQVQNFALAAEIMPEDIRVVRRALPGGGHDD